MAQSSNYVNVKVDKDARRRGRVTKAKLGITWTEFISRAADELDPDEQSHD